MEGLDSDWVDAGTDRTARYAALPFGTFTFRVIAANRDGVWNETGASIGFVVHPPFWRSVWFESIAAVAFFGAGIVLYRRRIRSLKRVQILQQSFARQLIDSQENDRKRIAAELHDSLSQSLVVIKNWAQMSISDTIDKVTNARLTEISTTASQALGEVRQIAYNLAPYQLDRLGLTSTIEEMIQKVSSASSIRFEPDISNIDRMLPKESEVNLYRIIQECINNVIKHSVATNCMIHIRRDEGSLRITIHDNGKGFQHEPQFPNAQGFGLAGLNERVRMLRGTLNIESEPGRGTRIEFHIPYNPPP